MDLKRVLEKRHCSRSFREKKAKLKDVLSVAEAILKGPMAGNIHTVKLILVDDAEKIKEIAAASPYNEFMADVGWLIVVCTDYAQIERMYGKRGRHYATQQAGAAIENMFLRVVDLGLATCWTGSFEEAKIKRILSIPDALKIETILPIGYEFTKPVKKAKPSLKQVLSYNKFGKKNW